MTEVDPIFARLTAPGEPFAIVERDGQRQFANMPPDLNMLIESARRHGDKTFIVEGEKRLSFNDVFRLRDALVPMLGITARGDRVAICMRNRAEWAIGFLAAIRAGGVPALVNSRGAPAELAAAVADVTPVVVLADP
jgi:acyl-CoA synthetase (AMP-forming)/AMP-acid ligase II